MKLRLLLLPLFLLFSINSMFAVKTATVPTEKEAVSITDLRQEPTKKQKKSGFFQRILEKKIVKKITKKLGLADEDRTKRSGNLFGLLATIFGVLGLILLFTQLGLVGILFGIAAFVLGLIGIKRDDSITLGIVGTILGGLMVLLFLIAIVFLASLL